MSEKEMQYKETAEITKVIRELHQDKGVSLSFISKKTGLSQPSITKIVQGKKKRMRLENRQVIYKFLKETFDFKPSIN